MFDDLIAVVRDDFGRDNLDPVEFRKRHYDRWISELKLLSDGYVFEVEARRLIEHALLVNVTRVLPITATDIMSRLQVEPGPEVGTLMSRARQFYESSMCSGNELLERLAEERKGARSV